MFSITALIWEGFSPSLAELYKYATYDAMKRKQQGRINPADRL